MKNINNNIGSNSHWKLRNKLNNELDYFVSNKLYDSIEKYDRVLWSYYWSLQNELNNQIYWKVQEVKK